MTHTVFVASLSGANETAVVDASARGTAFLEVASDGHLDFAVTGAASWTGDVTGLEVHVGNAGQDGASVVNLLGGGASFDATTHTVAGSLAINRGVATALLGNPTSYYVQVSTSGAPQGLLRDQTQAFSSFELHAVLLGSLETFQPDPSAHGGATLRVSASRGLTWVLAMGAPSIGAIVQAHVHAGDPALNGAIVYDLGSVAGVLDAGAGTLTGTGTVPLDLMSRVGFDPSAFYVNVHTTAAPGGIARGPLALGAAEVWATLDGSQEVAVVDPAARGAVGLVLSTFATGHAYMAVPVPQAIANVTGMTVHVGAAGATGAVLLDLRAGANFVSNAATGLAEADLALDQATFARLIGDPAGLYANFTSAAAASGLARGQLTQSPKTVSAVLTGPNVVPAADPAALGLARVVFTGIHACAVQTDMTSPAASSVNGLQLHDGAAGSNGAMLIDLLNGTHAVVGGAITGNTVFTGATFVRVLANPVVFYVDAHTAAAPNGIARGQLGLLSESTPPTGLTYTTPVTYTTGGPVAPNLPHNGGGAVAAYAVSPALPAGLSLSGTTGVISGTPTAVTAAADYVVTATNASGSTQATVHLTVTVAAPSNLAYTTPVAYVVGTLISPNLPSNSGGVITLYGVSPALPGGLGLDTSTGAISGTPTGVSAAANYTVTGSNASGSTQTVVNVKVDSSLAAPSSLSYTTPVSYPTGTAITTNSPTISGGAVATWSISPALPTGLAFDTSTGKITGTPTAVTAAADYVVTAGNLTGSTQATVHVTVTLGAPANIQYDYNPGVGYVSFSSFTTMTPSTTGGTVASWSIAATSGSYSLPSGLSFSTTTGVISGVPIIANYPGTQTSFTVTATNATGSTTATVTVIVY